MHGCKVQTQIIWCTTNDRTFFCLLQILHLLLSLSNFSKETFCSCCLSHIKMECKKYMGYTVFLISQWKIWVHNIKWNMVITIMNHRLNGWMYVKIYEENSPIPDLYSCAFLCLLIFLINLYFIPFFLIFNSHMDWSGIYLNLDVKDPPNHQCP